MATSLLSVFTCNRAYPGRVLVCVALLQFAPQGAMAFGAKAHRIVGEVAELYLCEDARTALEQIAPDTSLAEAGLWADRIRSIPAWDIARTWHYINVPDGMALSQAPRLSRGDVLTAINRFEAELADPASSKVKRRQAYFFLVHFIADVHQPLHVGKRRDRGGNSVDVQAGDKLTTLHQYWDAGVLDSVQANPGDYAAQIAGRYDGLARQWQDFAPELWAIESQAFRPEVYDFGEQDPSQSRVALDEAYQARALQITEFRLVQAGIRLAATLNHIWCWGAPDA